MSGVIDDRAIAAFDSAVLEAPEIKTIVFDFVPGSLDDESNLLLAKKVRELEFRTVVPRDGLVASGGTDLFLAGIKREVRSGGCVGVHTWGNALTGLGSETPKDDPIHQLYLSYYADIGLDESFYWFTLEAAGPDDSHWMTLAELRKFEIPSEKRGIDAIADSNDEATVCDHRLSDGFDALTKSN